MQAAVIYLSSLAVFLTPFARAAEIPIIILALCGLVMTVRNYRAVVERKSIKIYSLLFLMLWLPIIFSMPDAVKISVVIKLIFEFVRFYFFGVLVICKFEDGKINNKIVSLVSIVLIIWIVDALIQKLVGYDLLGFPLSPKRLNGIFGRHFKLGLYLAVYSPILMVYIDRIKVKYYKILLFCLLSLVIFLAGSRGGWIMYAVGCTGILGYLYLKYQTVNLKLVIAVASLMVVVFGASYLYVPTFTARVDKSLLVFSGDLKLVDRATSSRLPIWTVAVRMFKDHPINGVGASDFRYAYNDYADKDDPFANASGDGTGAMHSHNMIFDIGCETGTLGLLGLVGFCGTLLFLWIRADRSQRLNAAPFAIGLLAALFPLNTHFAFYSGAWSQVIFWYAAFYIAAISMRENPAVDGNVQRG